MSPVRVETVYGNTGCLFLTGICIPFYRLGEKEWILLDSGSRFVRGELLSYLDAHQIRVRAVLCSHAHFDHIENNRCLQESHGAGIVMTAFDGGMAHDALALKACFYSQTESDNEVNCGEMICRADCILHPDERRTKICGTWFELLPLPGHAASHMGILTPDGVMYLADSLFTSQVLEREKLFYMFSWRRALETMERIQSFRFQRYILAHQGVESEICGLAAWNRKRLEQELEALLWLCIGEPGLEELAGRVAEARGISVQSVKKARFMERTVRSMAEYWLEQGELEIRLKDGRLVYVRR